MEDLPFGRRDVGLGDVAAFEQLEQDALYRWQQAGKGTDDGRRQFASGQQCLDLVEQKLEIEGDHGDNARIVRLRL